MASLEESGWLSTADGLLLTISNALSHDFFFRMVNPKASAIKRVASAPQNQK